MSGRLGKNHSPTICWKCKHAVPVDGNGCNWSINFLPVPNWKAEKHVRIEKGGHEVISYCVKECPKFEKG